MATKQYVMAGLFGEHPQLLLDHVPHCRDLAMIAISAGPGEFVAKVPFDASLVGDPERGVVFGGVITTLLDHAGGIAVMCGLEEVRSVATIDLRIDYMRPATPGRDLVGYACCYRVTRHVAFVTGAAYHDDRDDPFAKFQATYMLGTMPAGVAEGLEEWAADEGRARSEAERDGQ